MKFAEAGQIERAAEFATRMGALSRMLGEVDADTRKQVEVAIAEAVRPYEGPDGISLTGSIWLISAHA
jgi:hypothetical protein